MIDINDKQQQQKILVKKIRKSMRLERAWWPKLKLLLREQFKLSAEYIGAGMKGYIDWAVDENKNDMINSFKGQYVKVADSFGLPMIKELQREKQDNPVGDAFWDSVNLWAATEAATKVALVNETTKIAISKIVSKGFSEGLSNAEISKNLLKRGKATELWRARRIAVTETHYAANKAENVAVKASGRVMNKEWLDLADSRVRVEHGPGFASGETVPVDEYFTGTGESIMFPGEGSAWNSVNCRCGVLYHSARQNYFR